MQHKVSTLQTIYTRQHINTISLHSSPLGISSAISSETRLSLSLLFFCSSVVPVASQHTASWLQHLSYTQLLKVLPSQRTVLPQSPSSSSPQNTSPSSPQAKTFPLQQKKLVPDVDWWLRFLHLPIPHCLLQHVPPSPLHLPYCSHPPVHLHPTHQSEGMEPSPSMKLWSLFHPAFWYEHRLD